MRKNIVPHIDDVVLWKSSYCTKIREWIFDSGA